MSRSGVARSVGLAAPEMRLHGGVVSYPPLTPVMNGYAVDFRGGNNYGLVVSIILSRTKKGTWSKGLVMPRVCMPYPPFGYGFINGEIDIAWKHGVPSINYRFPRKFEVVRTELERSSSLTKGESSDD